MNASTIALVFLFIALVSVGMCLGAWLSALYWRGKAASLDYRNKAKIAIQTYHRSNLHRV